MAEKQIQFGWKVDDSAPIDSRFTVADETARLGLPAGVVYEGLWVYQEDNNITYVLTDASDHTDADNWDTLGSAEIATDTKIGSVRIPSDGYIDIDSSNGDITLDSRVVKTDVANQIIDGHLGITRNVQPTLQMIAEDGDSAIFDLTGYHSSVHPNNRIGISRINWMGSDTGSCVQHFLRTSSNTLTGDTTTIHSDRLQLGTDSGGYSLTYTGGTENQVLTLNSEGLGVWADSSATVTKETIDTLIGAGDSGSATKFYNEQGDFVENAVTKAGIDSAIGVSDSGDSQNFYNEQGDFVAVTSATKTAIDNAIGVVDGSDTEEFYNKDGTFSVPSISWDDLTARPFTKFTNVDGDYGIRQERDDFPAVYSMYFNDDENAAGELGGIKFEGNNADGDREVSSIMTGEWLTNGADAESGQIKFMLKNSGSGTLFEAVKFSPFSITHNATSYNKPHNATTSLISRWSDFNDTSLMNIYQDTTFFGNTVTGRLEVFRPIELWDRTSTQISSLNSEATLSNALVADTSNDNYLTYKAGQSGTFKHLGYAISIKEDSTTVNRIEEIEIMGTGVTLEADSNNARKAILTFHETSGGTEVDPGDVVVTSSYERDSFPGDDQSVTITVSGTRGTATITGVSIALTGFVTGNTGSNPIVIGTDFDSGSTYSYTTSSTTVNVGSANAGLITATISYTQPGETGTTKSGTLTLTSVPDNPTPVAFLSNPQNFIVTPVGPNVEKWDTGNYDVLQGSTDGSNNTYDYEDNDGWDVGDITDGTFTAGTFEYLDADDNDWTITDQSIAIPTTGDITFVVQADLQQNNTPDQGSKYQNNNVQINNDPVISRPISLRVGGKGSDAFEANAGATDRKGLRNLNNFVFDATDQPDRELHFGVASNDDIDGYKVQLLKKPGDAFFIAYDKDARQIDTSTTIDSNGNHLLSIETWTRTVVDDFQIYTAPLGGAGYTRSDAYFLTIYLQPS